MEGEAEKFTVSTISGGKPIAKLMAQKDNSYKTKKRKKILQLTDKLLDVKLQKSYLS